MLLDESLRHLAERHEEAAVLSLRFDKVLQRRRRSSGVGLRVRSREKEGNVRGWRAKLTQFKNASFAEKEIAFGGLYRCKSGLAAENMLIIQVFSCLSAITSWN